VTIQELGRLAAGSEPFYLPTFVAPWSFERYDGFITEVAPALR
jgi:hypothetical protein